MRSGRNAGSIQASAIDVAPTVLEFLEFPQPKEMTGHSLIVDS